LLDRPQGRSVGFTEVQHSTVQITLELVKAEIGERVQLTNMTDCGPVTHPGHEVWKAQVRPHDLLEHSLPVATGGQREVGAIGERKKGQGKGVIDHNKKYTEQTE
jgi:hypothetical protein